MDNYKTDKIIERIIMKRNNKILAIVSFMLTIIALTVAFFHQFEISYSDCKKIKLLDGGGFYPNGYTVFHTQKEYLESATYMYDGADIDKVMKMDYSKYDYVMVQGAKVKRMYYSIKSTLLDDKSPDWAKARRFFRWCLFIEYQSPDNYMYIYQIDKNSRLRGFGGG